MNNCRLTYNSTDDNPVEGVISINSEAFPIPPDSIVIAFVQELNTTTKIIDDIEILENDTGNDWENGKINGIFSKAASAALSAYHNTMVTVCVRATINGHTETWTKPVMAQHLAS